VVTVAVSGGFDPLHVGHINFLKEARDYGDTLLVILNNDNWLKKKKGFVFMSENDRKEILKALRYVDDVKISFHDENPKDMSVCTELEVFHPDVFCLGGDKRRTLKDVPEINLCNELGIKMVWGTGGKKVRSSSEIMKGAVEKTKEL